MPKSKFVLRGLKPVDYILLGSGVFFAVLLIAAWFLPMVNPNLSALSKYSVQPLGGITFLLLGIFTIKTQKPPQRNLGFFLILFSAFAFFVSSDLIIKALS